jgi:hypothetical protein
MKRAALLGLVALIAAALLAACDSGDDGKTVGLPSGGVLSGTWGTGCLAGPAGGGIGLVAVFTAYAVELTEETWETDAACGGTPNHTSDGREDFGFTGIAQLPSGGEVTQVQTFATAARMTPNDQATADFWNNTSVFPNGLFGFTNWAPGVPKSVLGLDEDGNQAPVTLAKDIFAINDSLEPNQLFVGLDEDDGGTLDAGGYPTALHPLIVLLRQ